MSLGKLGFLMTCLGKVDVQDGLGVLVDMTALALARRIDLVDADLGVPTRDGEKVGPVGRGREGQVGDGVGGRVAERDVRLEVADGGARRRARRAAKECRHGCTERESWREREREDG